MKIYSPPQDIKVPSLTLPFNQKNEEAAEDAYLEEVKKWITSLGYKGKYTGEIVRFPVADGKAQYMFADGPRSFLVYLPLGDAWQYNRAITRKGNVLLSFTIRHRGGEWVLQSKRRIKGTVPSSLDLNGFGQRTIPFTEEMTPDWFIKHWRHI